MQLRLRGKPVRRLLTDHKELAGAENRIGQFMRLLQGATSFLSQPGDTDKDRIVGMRISYEKMDEALDYKGLSGATSLLTAVRDDLPAVMAEKDCLEAERDAWRSGLQRLTPMGSEFCTPEACVEYAHAQKMEGIRAKMDLARLQKGNSTFLVTGDDANGENRDLVVLCQDADAAIKTWKEYYQDEDEEDDEELLPERVYLLTATHGAARWCHAKGMPLVWVRGSGRFEATEEGQEAAARAI